MMATPQDGHRRVQPADNAQVLNAVELELLAKRAQRTSASGTATLLLRVFSFLLLFGLLAAGLGAMWYLQSVAVQQHPVRPSPSIQKPAH